jgi:hypothetical protein
MGTDIASAGTDGHGYNSHTRAALYGPVDRRRPIPVPVNRTEMLHEMMTVVENSIIGL